MTSEKPLSTVWKDMTNQWRQGAHRPVATSKDHIPATDAPRFPFAASGCAALSCFPCGAAAQGEPA